jgi:hypothetical protein
MPNNPKPATPTPPEPKPPPEPLPPNPPPIPPSHKAERATWFLASFTGIVAIFTAALAIAAFWTVREARRASSEQLGVQTWLHVDPKFNSKELKLARKKLAHQLDPYDPGKRAEIDDDVLEFFESVGALYNRNLLNKELAASSFSYWAIHWWEVAKAYVADERRAEHDESVYGEFEAFAKAMQKHKPSLSDADLKRFLAAEKALEIQ